MYTNKQLAERLIDCFNSKDTVLLQKIISDTVKHTAGGTAFSADLEGQANYLAYMAGTVFPRFASLNFKAERVIEDIAAGIVAVEWQGSFVTSAGKPYLSRGVFVIECRDGQIEWVRDYFDTEKTKQAMS
jgi:ketosteroid isomerase-like protein